MVHYTWLIKVATLNLCKCWYRNLGFPQTPRKPRKELLPLQSIFWRRRKVCVDRVPHFCVSVGIMSDTQHAVIFCDYIQTYYSLSNCVYTVSQFFTVWQE